MKNQVEFNFRPANSAKDIEFIYDLILEGSTNGNFSQEYATSKENARQLKYELVSIVLQNKRLNGAYAYAVIYQSTSTTIGFAIISAIEEKKGNEIYMASIHPSYRNQGYGKKMVASITEQFKNNNQVLMARCHTNSERMYQILLKQEFQYIHTGSEGYRFLVFNAPNDLLEVLKKNFKL